MRTLCALIVLGVLGGTPSASALTSQPTHLRSLRQLAMSPELVVRRPGHPNRHRYHDYRYRYDYRNQGPRLDRPYVEPQTRAAPMERVPQVAPLAPRVGK